MINYKVHRKAIEAFYKDKMTVLEHKRVADPATHASKMIELEVCKDVPCHLDWGDSRTVKQDNHAEASQKIRVILAPEHVINAGSTVRIHTEAGRDYTFKASSPASVVVSHQELSLEVVAKA